VLPTSINIEKIVDRSPISSDFSLEHFEEFSYKLHKVAFPEEIQMTESSLLTDRFPRYKKGPNGSALLTSRIDAFASFKDEKLFDSLTKWFESTGNNKVLNDLNKILDNFLIPKKILEESVDSVLHPLNEKAGKTRLIAICDY